MKRLVVMTATALLALVSPAVQAQQVVHFGTLTQFRSPNDLDLTGTLPYVINLDDDVDRVVRGVTFTTDRNPIPGYSFTFPHEVTVWQTKPEFGATADDDALEEVMQDIRWTDRSGVGAFFDVIPGRDYKIQLLWSGNHDENRRWSFDINGSRAATEVQSNGEFGYDPAAAIVYTATRTQPFNSSELSIIYTQGTTGADGNGILQAIIIEDTGIQRIPGDATLDGVVDMDDFDLIRANLFTGDDISEGDVDFDGDVDLDDFGLWKQEAGFGPANVPEPASLVLLWTGGVALGAIAWRRRTRGGRRRRA